MMTLESPNASGVFISRSWRAFGKTLYALRLSYGWEYGSKAVGQTLDTHCQEESKWQV